MANSTGKNPKLGNPKQDNLLEKIRAIPESNLPESPKRRRELGKGAKFTLGFASLCAVCGSILGSSWLSQEFSPSPSRFNRGLEYLVKQLAIKVSDLEKKREGKVTVTARENKISEK